MSDAPDLFGHTPPQGDLFSAAPRAPAVPAADPERVRRKLHAMLDELRAADAGSPWPRETMRANRLIFPQMTNWLPPEEGEQLVLAFHAELRRLQLAA
jgi:hypothetical protein